MGNNGSSNSGPPPPGWGSTPARGSQFPVKKYSYIPDNYHSLDQVQTALRQAGLESSSLIVGIDFTKSNEWTGKYSFGGKSLHAIGPRPNPYEQAISIIGRTLAGFDEDDMIPCFGFGDASTHDQDVFSFYQDHHSCNGFDEALVRYRQIVPNLKLSGPTSFAPIIEVAMRTVEQSGGQYHVLVIIADGQVTRSVDTRHGSLSPQERATVDAVVRASAYPLSIILVGVGDGPWDMMRDFDDKLPARAFDNFQFVNFSDIMAKNLAPERKEAAFALAALMEIPLQYKATIELKLLGQPTGHLPRRDPLPPPPAVQQADRMYAGSFAGNQATRPQFPHVGGGSSDYGSGPPQYNPSNIPTAYPPAGYPPSTPRGHPHQSESAATSRDIGNDQHCPVCLTEKKDMAFGCGHQTCRECGKNLQTCPICREKISSRIKLY